MTFARCFALNPSFSFEGTFSFGAIWDLFLVEHEWRQQGPTNEWPQQGPTNEWAQQGPTNEWAQMNPLEWAQQGPTNEWAQQGPTNEWAQQGPNESPNFAWYLGNFAW